MHAARRRSIWKDKRTEETAIILSNVRDRNIETGELTGIRIILFWANCQGKILTEDKFREQYEWVSGR